MGQRLMAGAMGGNRDVLIEEHATAGGQVVARVTLNVEATLNALSLDMARTIAATLRAWRNDDRIACVLFLGAGERAFCAGGDIQALYAAMLKNTPPDAWSTAIPSTSSNTNTASTTSFIPIRNRLWRWVMAW